MKRQIKSLEEEKLKLQEEKSELQKQLQIAQACEYYFDPYLDIASPKIWIIIKISFHQALQVTILN